MTDNPERLEQAARAVLVIGSKDLLPKDDMLLRSLIRAMGGHGNHALKYGEDLAACDVAILPAHSPVRPPAGCIAIHLLGDEAPETDARLPGIVLRTPLRLSNFGTALSTAIALRGVAPSGDRATNGLAQLLTLLLNRIASKERRATRVPVLDGSPLIIDFSAERYYAAAPLADLLAGRYTLGMADRADAQEKALAHSDGSGRLRDLVWAATHHLGAAEIPGYAPLSGRFELSRWPDASAISRPGYPKLVAVLTARACTVQECSALSGLSATAVEWFLATCVAFGIMRPASEEPDAPAMGSGAAPGVDPRAATGGGPPRALPPATTRTMIGRLRDRLKLW